MVFEICVTQFYGNTKSQDGKRTKSNNFPGDILKPDIIFHWPQIGIVFQ